MIKNLLSKVKSKSKLLVGSLTGTLAAAVMSVAAFAEDGATGTAAAPTKKFRNAGVRTTLVGIMLVVIRDKFFSYTQNILFRFLTFEQSAFKQLIDAVANHKVVLFFFVGGVS